MNRSVVALVAIQVGIVGASNCASPERTPADPPEVQKRFAADPAPPPPGADDYANQHFPSPLSIQDATAILIRTNVFAENAVGIGATPTRQVQALNVVLDQANAFVLLERISDEANPAGKLYAVCGLQVVNPRRGRRLAAALGHSTDRVVTYRGCTISTETVGQVLTSITERNYGAAFRRDRKRTIKYFESAG